MNFKDWKKISEDAKTCTLEHPKGHTMTIAVGSLPKILREQLKRLDFAKGGKVDKMMSPNDALSSGEGGTSEQGRLVRSAHEAKHDPRYPDERLHKIDMKFAKKEAAGRAELERHNKPNLKGLAHGGEVEEDHKKQTHDAAMKEIEHIKNPGSRPKSKHDPRYTMPSEDSGRKFVRFDHGPNYYEGGTPGGTVEQSAPDATDEQPAPNQAPVTVNVNAAPATETPVAERKDGLVETGVDIPKPVVGQEDINQNTGNVDPLRNQQNIQEAAKGDRDVKVAESQADKVRTANYLNEQDRQHEKFVNNQQMIMEHVMDAATALRDGSINPKHYMESLSSSGKVATALGIALGGVAGGQNFALDYVNKQIDRDIKAQEADLDKRKTVLGAYQQLFGPSLAAYNATRMTMNDAYVNQGHLIASQLGTPRAYAEWLKMKAEKANENARLLRDSAMDMTAHPGFRGSGGGSGAAPNGGKAGSGAIPGAKNEVKEWNKDLLLGPDAERAFNKAQYHPTLKKFWENGSLERQWNNAQQADKSISRIREVYDKLSNNTGGISGRIHRNFNPHSMAAVGAAAGTTLGVLGSIPLTGGLAAGPAAALGATGGGSLGEGAGQMISGATNTSANREYDANQSAITGMISSALKGTNISGGQIDEIVRKNSPESGDTKEAKEQKLQNIIEFIRQHTETNLLHDAKMLNGQKK